MELTRRNFVVGSGAALLASALAGCSANSSSSQNAPSAGDANAAVDRDWEKESAETVDCDFLVIGTGMTGTAAAIDAAQRGMSVVLLEKNDFYGGSTNWAEGIFSMSSTIQDEANVKLPTIPELLTQAMEYHHYNANRDILKHLYSTSAENVKWLLDLGVELRYVVFGVPGVQSQTRLEYVGTGVNLIKVLRKNVDEMSNIDLRMSTPARKLIFEDSKVCGAYAEGENGVVRINAKGTLLATGGYSSSSEHMKKYLQISDGDFIYDTGIAGRDGEGIDMAKELGGVECRHMGVISNFGPILKGDQYRSHLYAATSAASLRFNEKGERYGNETLDILNFAFSGNNMQQQKASFSIASEAQIKQWTEVAAPFGGGFFMLGLAPLTELPEQLEIALNAPDPQVFRCETLQDCAAKAGVDSKTLMNTIAQYNKLCAAGKDTDFGKSPEWLIPVDENGPYYLFNHKIGIFSTSDGLRVNEFAQVLDKDAKPIDGLFAGGDDAGGLNGDCYDISVAPCTTQGWCVCSGRTAAQFVAENLL